MIACLFSSRGYRRKEIPRSQVDLVPKTESIDVACWACVPGWVTSGFSALVRSVSAHNNAELAAQVLLTDDGRAYASGSA